MVMDYKQVIILLYITALSMESCYEKAHCLRNCHNYNRNTQNLIYEIHCYKIVDKIETLHSENVHHIEIYASNLHNVTPKLFSNYGNVKSIYMVGDNITNVAPGTFNTFLQLQYLNLTDNNINTLSKNVYNRLGTLVLSKNNITNIEKGVLEELTTLVLSHNSIFDVSPLMENCQKVALLDISYNYINQIVFSEKCSTLSHLNVSHNSLSDFTTTGFNQVELFVLDLSWNNLTFLASNDLKQFSELVELYLNNNALFITNNVPVGLFQNKKALQYLNLAFTGIQILAIGTFSNMINLRTLDISHNSLTNVPKGLFHELIKLENLYLNDNHFTYFEYNGFGKLSKISLHNNLWNCGVLSDVIGELASNNITIITGSAYDQGNIFGIKCFDEDLKKTYTISDNISDLNLNKLEKEYYTFLDKMQENVQQILRRQESFHNLSSFDLRTQSKIYLDGLSRANQNFSDMLRKDIEKIVKQISDAVSSLEKISQNSIISSRKIQNETLIQWSQLQKKFMDVLKEDLRDSGGQIQKEFQEVMMKIQDVFTETMAYIKENLPNQKIFSERKQMDLPITASFRINDSEKSASENDYKPIAIGVYCILLVLMARFTVMLVMYFKTQKHRKVNHEECNPLSNIQV